MPGREVGQADRRVRLVDVLATRPRGPICVDTQVFLVDLDLGGHVFEEGRDVHGGEAGLAPVLGVERGHPDQAVHAPLGGQQPVGEAAVDDERGREQPGLLPLGRLVDLDREAAALGPSLVHPQEHLGPVLRVGPARAGVHFAHGVELVVLAGEQRLQLQRTEPRPERVDRLDQLGVERGVTGSLGGGLLGQLEQRRGVLERAAQRVELVEVGRDASEFLGDGARVVGVVPEIGPGHLGLEFGAAHFELLAPEVALGLGQPLPQRFELRCEVAGELGRRPVRRRHGRT